MARPWKRVLIGVITVFTVLAGYISFVIYERQAALAGVSHYNIAWSASQAAIELTRLQLAIAVAIASPDPDPDPVQLRYNILLNRMALLNSGAFRSFAQTEASSREIMKALDATLPRVGPLIDGLGRAGGPDRAALAEANSLLLPLTPKLLQLAAAANRFGGEMVARDQHALIRLHWQFSALVAGLILCAIALIVLLLRHNGMLVRAEMVLRKLATELQRTTISRRLLDEALNNMSQGLCMVDAGQRIIVTNRNFTSLLNLPDELVAHGSRFDGLLDEEGTQVAGAETIRKLLLAQRALADGGVPASTHEELPDGRIVAITHQPIEEGGWVATYDDVTERRRAQDHLAFLARHDALTGLPNRLMLHEEMEKALPLALRQRDRFAVFCLDLDRFKSVNDTLGHPIGDILLQQVADRLRGCVGERDLIARLGGDEFAIIQPGEDLPARAADLAQCVIAALSSPFDIRGHQIVIGSSIGIALAPLDGGDAASLMKSADLALYRAKTEKRGTFRFFEAEMDTLAQARRTMETELRRALVKEEFEVYFQPLVNVARDEISGFETLLRWRHPEKGLLLPEVFLPLAEEIGLISALEDWVLRRACAVAATWPSATKVAINLSSEQFRTPKRLVTAVRDALASAGLPPSRLELEITGTVFLNQTETTLRALHEIRDTGVRISLDDFGTGYSSLCYLRSFPFDKIKIDKSFITTLETNQGSMAIVRAVAGLASALGMTTTATGVETEMQLDHLHKQGCTEIQGFLISPAVPPEDVPALMRSMTRLEATAALV